MQVLLLEDVQNFGKAGDIVAVSEGYARNFLFPQGKAALATKQVLATKETKDAQVLKKAEEELAAQQAIASTFENTEIIMKEKTKEGDGLYGSVTAKEAASVISKQVGTTISARKVRGDFPIKSLGSYPITVQLAQGVEFQMIIVIMPYEEN